MQLGLGEVMLSKVVRVSKKNTIYIPKDIAEKVGVSEGILVEVSVEDGKIVLTPIPDPLWLALHGPKFAEVSIEDVERTSEEMQEGLVNEHEGAS
jgi:AbrB family looped-hinge helix DNA binding protein